jgi:hypothetical protein
MGKVKVLLLVMMAVVFAVSTCFALENEFKAKLTPKEETKKPKAKSSGKAEFKLSKDGKVLSYKLHVKHIKDVSAAHIHIGKKGEDGPPVVGLFSGEKKGKFSGELAKGNITSEDLLGDYKGKPLDELLGLMRSGDTYVNVHTDANPDGEIRGQIK